MAHFAELDDKGIVKRVIVVDNKNCINPVIKLDYPNIASDVKSISGSSVSSDKASTGMKETVVWEDEGEGIKFIQKLLGGTWVQTSYNSNIRKNYAGIGFTYDSIRNAFIAPQPYKSWILNETTCQWEAPIPHPEKGFWYWDEETLSWLEVK